MSLLKGIGTGDVAGQPSSVDSEIAIFNGTNGKSIKRATTTGLVKATSGVISAASAGVDYVVPNIAITGATKTKITYDTKGFVTSGGDATTADIADSTNKRYVTDAQLTVIGNTSNTNTGDQTLNSLLPSQTGNGGKFLFTNGTTTSWNGVTQQVSVVMVGNAGSVTIDDSGEYIIDISGLLSATGVLTLNLDHPTLPFTMFFDNVTTGGFAVIMNSIYTLPTDVSVWYYDGALFEQVFGVNQYVPVSRTVAGHALTNNVTLVKGDVGLGNVDNTSDATKNSTSAILTNKTISTATNTLTIASDQSFSSHKITNLADPNSIQDAATKNYVDSSVTGFLNKITATAATTGTLPSYTYNNGSSGVGATITATTSGTFTIDNHLTVLNDYLLVKNEVSGNAPYNGVYKVTTVGTSGTAFVLTRVIELDISSEFAGTAVFVTSGISNSATTWTCITSRPIVGTTNIVFVQSGASTSYSAGIGLTLTGTQFSVNNATVPYKTDKLSVFSTTTSSELANVISDETGSGALVFGNTPTITTPIIAGLVTRSTDGDQDKVSIDTSLLRKGTWSIATSGSMYTLLGDLAMSYWTHNVALDNNGNFLGRDDTGACTLWVFTEGDLIKTYSAPSSSAGTVPVWSLKETINVQTGAVSYAGSIIGSNLSNTNTGDITLNVVGASPNANGASLSSQALTLQPANSTNPGVITTGAQTFSGIKTFTDSISGSINKLTITSPANSATLTIADGKILTSSNTVTLAGTDGSTLNIGSGGALGSAAYTNSTAYDTSGAATTVQGNLTTHTSNTGISVHGLGTMSTQAASGVTITGGTINVSTVVGTTSISTPAITTAASGNLIITPNSNAHVILQSSGTGNVSIGTNGYPIAKCEISAGFGNYTSDTDLLLSEAHSVGFGDLRIGIDNSTHYAYMQAHRWSTGYSTLLINPNGGNVGIGITPDEKFNVNGAIRLTSNASNFTSSAGTLIDYYSAGGVSRFVNSNGSAAGFFTLDNVGRISIASGVAGTSMLTLPAGSSVANTAPLQFTSGALETTPRIGCVEFLTDAWYGTITTGAARKTFAFLESPVFTTQISTPKIVTASGNLEILPPGNADIVLQGSGTGKVGIGTAAPGYKLDVAGTTDTATAWGSEGNLLVSGNFANILAIGKTNTGGNAVIAAQSAKDIIFGDYSGGYREAMRIKSGGNVGIGTAGPVSILAVAGGTITSTGPNGAMNNPIVDLSRTAQPTLAAFTKTSNTGGTFYSGIEGSAGNSIASGSSAYATVLWNTGATPMQFGTSDAARMTILSGGNVGIGTTGPGNTLVVRGATPTVDIEVSNFTHSFADSVYSRANSIGAWSYYSGTTGGTIFVGLGKTTSPALALFGASDDTSPTVAPVSFVALKRSGTDTVALASTEKAFSFNNGASAWSTGTNLVTILGSGNAGFRGVTSPTAAIHLPAGTTVQYTAPLKFTSGTLLTTPEAGAVEYDGTFFHVSNSSTRYRLGLNYYNAVSALNVTPTTIFTPTKRGAYVMAAFIIDAGANYHATATILFDATTVSIQNYSHGANITITLAGNAVQITQSSGTTQNVDFYYSMIAV